MRSRNRGVRVASKRFSHTCRRCSGFAANTQALLRLRREHAALRTGKLWHMASDESSYVFARETEEERIVIAFNNADRAHELRIPLADTPGQRAAEIAMLFGETKAEVAGGELRVTMSGQSLSIFLLN